MMFYTVRWRLLLLFVSVYAVEDSGYSTRNENTSAVYTPPYLEHHGSFFSPRMDFEQWKPLTGRGDPLRNDPTYDYEPPMLDKVHYWLDPASRKPAEGIKSEVLLLGVSSKKPSVQPNSIKRETMEGFQKLMSNIKNTNFNMFSSFSRPKSPSRSSPMSGQSIAFPPVSTNKIKYEDFNYKYTENNIPMTILVPPPLPPPDSFQTMSIDIPEASMEQFNAGMSTIEDISNTFGEIKTNVDSKTSIISTTTENMRELETTNIPSTLTIEESNLIFQSSSVNSEDKWKNINKTGFIGSPVTSDYAGWGPTTTVNSLFEVGNDTHNLINSLFDNSKVEYTFYKPMFSEVPPPPQSVDHAYESLINKPTGSDPTPFTTSTMPSELESHTTEQTVIEETTISIPDMLPPNPSTSTPILKRFKPTESSLLAMMESMMQMPFSRPNPMEEMSPSLPNFDSSKKNSKLMMEMEMESLQTMNPPPVSITTERMPIISQYKTEATQRPNFIHKFMPTKSTIKFPQSTLSIEASTTPLPLIANLGETKPSIISGPMYVIIQGHSKVKTYGSKNKTPTVNKDSDSKENTLAKYVNPKEKVVPKKIEKKSIDDKTKISRSLKSLVEDGEGKIEIQEANLGIKLDISDGKDVPIEIYRKGFVETEENEIAKIKKKSSRNKRQVGIADLLPVDVDTIDEYLYDYLKKKSDEKSFTGIIAKAVTSDAAEEVSDMIENVNIR